MTEHVINNSEELENLRDRLEIEIGKSIIFKYDESFEKDDSYPLHCKKHGKSYLIFKKK
jgi:hypothetical protein